MPEEEKMTIDERFKYLRLVKKQYLKADRLERGRLLDDMGTITGLHRKSLIRLRPRLPRKGDHWLRAASRVRRPGAWNIARYLVRELTASAPEGSDS